MKIFLVSLTLGILVFTSVAMCEESKEASLQKALQTAIEEYDLNGVKKAINNKADLNAPLPSGATPLKLAAELGSTELVKTLVLGGAKGSRAGNDEVNAFDAVIASGHFHLLPVLFLKGEKFDLNSPRGNFTPLTSAARAGNATAIEFLIGKGAKVDGESPDLRAPLSYAIESRSLPAIRALLKYKANPNKQGRNGRSPLHEGVNSGDPEIVSALIMGGAKVELKDSEGVTPLDLAVKMGDSKVVSLLQKEKPKLPAAK